MSYKPPQKSLEQLQTEKDSIMEKIKNGAHLDYYSMQKLTRHLEETVKQINELEKEIKEYGKEVV